MEWVVHCKKASYDVYIGRPSKWGNPFVIGKHGTRDEVIQRYREWLMSQPELLAEVKTLKERCWVATVLPPHAMAMCCRNWPIWRPDYLARCLRL